MYVIAEIGFNHGGSADLTVKMVEAAASAGADAVKLQSFYASDLVMPENELYQAFKAGELSQGGHARARKAAAECGIDFVSTPFSPRWVDFLEGLEPAGYKVASMDVNNHVLLKAIAETGKKVYISSGASTLEEVKTSVDFLNENGAGDVCALHCVSNYPTRPEDAMLYMIPRMKKALNAKAVGFSDHTLGTAVAVAAVALGAKVVEKHFTIDKNLTGPDHKISADIGEMRLLVEQVRQAEAAVRESAEAGRADEDKRRAMRRGVYAACDIAEGEIITLEMLSLVRPEVTPLEDLEKIVGKTADRSFKKGSPVN